MWSILLSCFYIFRVLSESSGLSSNRFRRITGGHLYEIQDIPFLVSLRYKNVYYCAGSILSDQFILTAATCERPVVEEIKVRVGSSYYNQKGRTIRAGQFISHPDYNNVTFEKDVAIIVLQQPLNFTKNAQSVTLPTAEEKLPEPGQFVRIAGWGFTDPKTDINSSEEMRSAELPILSQSTCGVCYPDRVITEFVFCGGYFLGGTGPSSGDIGGPVVYKGIQYGVVSFTGDAGAYPLSPAVFTSVPKVRGFIQTYTKV
ncbi:trypsin-7-like [Coccinella septempunctata]|uniref:trypsin-7-like n=1 Tax=Coccinella septempunctata TaxID=41139 RepID=UPI001D08C0D4|nr:trypsin-7-like [Coccinella septempunctata]